MPADPHRPTAPAPPFTAPAAGGRSPEVVIVGGGVIGLSIAYVLAGEGRRCTVLDRGALGRAASWAGAGIIAPGACRPTDHVDAPLRTLGARLHAEWSGALRAETGLDNGYRRSGGLDLALDADEVAELEESTALWAAEGIAFERVAGPELAAIEPGLTTDLARAYFVPDRAQIRNPWHLRALAVACGRRGVDLRPDCPVLGFPTRGERVLAVETPAGPIAADQFVVAAGAWSEALLAGLGVALPTPPVRGQIVLLRSRPPALRRIVELGPRYLVPRDDGRVLVGSTEEHVGFEARTTPGGVRDLIDLALRLCPALAAAEVERTWAGLRPGNPDGRPTIDRAPGLANLILAAGHKRSGLQLSPGTAELVAALLQGRPAPIDPTPYRLDRPLDPIRPAFRS